MSAITIARATALTIGALSGRTGVNIETIRYYERIGILPVPSRTESGRRTYGPEKVRQLAFVRRARELGFSLDDIRALLALAEPGQVSCADVRRIAMDHLEDVRAKLADLAKLEHVLAGTVARCSGEKAPACPVLDVLNASAR